MAVFSEDKENFAQNNMENAQNSSEMEEDEDISEDEQERLNREMEERRRKVRKGYRNLLMDIYRQEEKFLEEDQRRREGGRDDEDDEIIVDENGRPSIDDESILASSQKEGEVDLINEGLDRAANLYEKVDHPEEALLDATAIKQLSRLLRQRCEGFNTNVQEFNPTKFAEKLTLAVGGTFNEEGNAVIAKKDWSKLGQIVKPMFQRGPWFSYMIGSFELGPPTEDKKKTARDAKKEKAPIDFDPSIGAVPTKHSEVVETETASNLTEILVGSTFDQLVKKYKESGKVPLCYFSFVCDPDDFGRTVENAFHVSFLIKLGKAKIAVNPRTDLPEIQPMKPKKSTEKGTPEDLSKKKQVVMNWNIPLWEAIKTNLGVTEASIVHNIEIPQE